MDGIAVALSNVAQAAVVFFTFLIAIYVIGRATFNIPWIFVEEYSAYAVVLLAFFPLAYVLRAGRHIRVDFLVRRLPNRAQSIWWVVTDFLAVALVAYLTMRGVQWFWYGFVTGLPTDAPSHIPIWPVYLVIPIGLTALGLALLRQVYQRITDLVRGGGEAAEK